MKSMRISLRIFAVAVALGTSCAQCIADDKYPAKPVTVIVPQAPGGANDAIARLVAQKLTENIGQQFVVENRPGAGGNIGTAMVARAPRDGYTLLLTVNSAHAINPSLYKNPGFDPVKDFEAITPVATSAYLLVANPSFPAKTLQELIALAKAKPGEIAYASAGNGTPNHLLGEMLKTQAGINLLHIPYKGASASATDLMAGRVPIAFQSMPSVISFVKAGKLTLIGVANEKRTRFLPDVPAMSETLPGFGTTPWYGFFAPSGTPKALITRIHAETLKALNSKDLQDKLALQGAEILSSTPDEFAALLKDELPKWAKIVKESGAQID
ncbi:MAG: tripartite tricarboxylate transporter substrate binding protein [Burkholderiales bacterium]